jgi:hypothetical protein
LRELRPHQAINRDAIIASLTKFGGSLDAGDTGTGKSTTFLAVCKALGARPAIITRKTIVPAWHEECAAMGVEPLFITNYAAAMSKNFPHGKVIKTKKVSPSTGEESVTSTYEWLTSGRVLFGFDEVQSCRAQKTINTKMLVAASTRFKTHMMSATPFTSPTEAYGIGMSLRLFHHSAWWKWQLNHGVRKNFHGHMEFCGDSSNPKKIAEGLAIMEGIHGDIFPSRGVRTTRFEIPGFPDEITTASAIQIEDPGAVEKIYHDMIAASRLEDIERAKIDVPEDLHDLVQPLAITQNLRARQEAEMHKCAAIVELALDARNAGESVAIFVNFDHTIEALAEMLDTRCIIRGDRTGENNYDRAHSLTEFQANRQWVILVNSAAGGAGISLHDPVTQKPRTSLISPPWSAIVLKQVLGRTLRLFGGFATRKLLFTQGTVEERVMKRVQSRMNCLDTLTDGDLDVANVTG